MSRVYDLPLTEWINAGLNQQSLDTVVSIIENNKELTPDIIKSNRANKLYIEKILREEIIKQFSGDKRPMLEVVLNSIDARPGDSSDYKIDLNLKRKYFVAQDNGKGMTLDEVLRLLIIPFSTEKTGIEEIGRFGVGFLSNFKYCIAAPKKGGVIVETKKDDVSYKINFYATGVNVSDIRMKVQKIKKNNAGTRVQIKTPIRRNALSEYLESSLNNIPSYVAKIEINKKPINTIGGTWYSSSAKMNIRGKDVAQPVGVRILSHSIMTSDVLDKNESSSNSGIKLTAQGVKVKEYNYSYADVSISFPPAIQLVEGRDQFKINDNYYSCVNAAFRSLESFVDNNVRNEKFVSFMGALIPQVMSALKIDNLKNIPNIDSLREKLFPKKEYVVNISDADKLKKFYGKSIDNKAFFTVMDACAYWGAFYSDSNKLIEDLNKPLASFKGKEFIDELKSGKLIDYPNLKAFVRYDFVFDNYSAIRLVNLDISGSSAFIHSKEGLFRDNSVLTINCNHPTIASPVSANNMYLLLADYLDAPEKQYLSEQLRNFTDSEKSFQRRISRLPILSYVPYVQSNPLDYAPKEMNDVDDLSKFYFAKNANNPAKSSVTGGK